MAKPSSKRAKKAVSADSIARDNAYWHSKTPLERLEALELMRQAKYGYDPLTARVQRTIQVIDLIPRKKKRTSRRKKKQK